MRISIALLLFGICFGFAPAVAQHTFDVKYPISPSSGSYYGGLLRITPTKILANSNDDFTKPIFIILDNDGMITQQAKLSFNIHSLPYYWFIPESHTIVVLIAEYLREKPGYPWHMIRMDTNLNIISDIILDSSVTGTTQEYNNATNSKCIMLKDSTTLVSTGYLVGYGTAPPYKRVACRFSRNGELIGRHIFENYSDYDEPMYQTFQNEIAWMYRYRDSLGKEHKGLRISDTAFIFNLKPVLLDLPSFNAISFDRKSFIYTSDSGIACIRPRPTGWPTITELTKFDSKYNKQWTIVVPGIDTKALQLMESRSGGYYIITQTVTDTSVGVFMECLRDIALSRVDASGRLIFTAYYGSGTCTQLPFAVMQDNDGGIIISGRYNMGQDGNCEFACNERDSTWIFKVDTLGRPTKKITGIEENVGALSIRLYPNPSSTELTVEFGRVDFYNSIEIIDNNAQVVQAIPINNISQAFTILDISSLASGNYFCRLRSQAGSITRPFIIQRS